MWMSPNIPAPGHLSFCKTISPPIAAKPLLWVSLSNLSLNPERKNRRSSVIRMGGGPRTYPGGVSKWQWKRMQAKKAKQLLKARLARERQIYQMRKRAELKAAVSELERPWEPVSDPPPTLFSVSADDQLKVLADRFQKPGGLDLWTHRDGPQLFGTFDGDGDGNGLPSARFFPKGVVHSVKPYGKVSSLLGEEIEQQEEEEEEEDGEAASGDSENVGRKKHKQKNRNSRNARVLVVDSRDSGSDPVQPYRVNPGRNTSSRNNRNARVLVDSRDSGPDHYQPYRVNPGRNTSSRNNRNARVLVDSRDSGSDHHQPYRVNPGRNTSSRNSPNARVLVDSRDSGPDHYQPYRVNPGRNTSSRNSPNARVLVESRDSGPGRNQSYRVNPGRNTSSRMQNARVVMDSRDSGPDCDQSYRVNCDRNVVSRRSRNGNCGRGRHRALRDSRHSQSDGGEVYDMLLGNDGSYGLEA